MNAEKESSTKMMTTTCRALSIFLLSSLTCFATQNRPTKPDHTVLTGNDAKVVQNEPGSSSAVPLLSCMGGGMALGGLISARWANRAAK